MSDKEKSKQYDVTEFGSLGLLALGDVGLKLWRDKKAEVKDTSTTLSDQKKESKDKDDNNE